MEELILNIYVVKVNGKPAIQLTKTISRKHEVKRMVDIALKGGGGYKARVVFRKPLEAAVRLREVGLY